jgi:hypothetical protein
MANTILPHTMALPATRNGLRLAVDTINELKAEPKHKHRNESAAMCHYDGWQRDRTMMLELL